METVATGPGKVKVRIRATGMCYSDLSGMTGKLGIPTPFVPGHEGAGEIIEVGEGVTSVASGDHVVVNFLPACGSCADCERGDGHLCTRLLNAAAGTPNFHEDGRSVFGLVGCGTFAEEVVLPHQSVVRIGKDVPFGIAALIGCGVTTPYAPSSSCDPAPLTDPAQALFPRSSRLGTRPRCTPCPTRAITGATGRPLTPKRSTVRCAAGQPRRPPRHGSRPCEVRPPSRRTGRGVQVS